MLPYKQRSSCRTPRHHRYHHRLLCESTQCMMILKTFVISAKTVKIKIINVFRYINLFLFKFFLRVFVYRVKVYWYCARDFRNVLFSKPSAFFVLTLRLTFQVTFHPTIPDFRFFPAFLFQVPLICIIYYTIILVEGHQ